MEEKQDLLFIHPEYGWKLRAKKVNGRILFNAADVCKCLGFDDVEAALNQYVNPADIFTDIELDTDKKKLN